MQRSNAGRRLARVRYSNPIAGLAAVFLVACRAAAAPPAGEIETSCVAARTAVRNGEFKVTAVYRFSSAGENGVEHSVACFFDFDRGDLRLDWEQPAPGVRNQNGDRVAVTSASGRTVMRIVRSQGKLLFYSPDVHSDGRTVAGSIDADDGGQRNSFAPLMFDPRVIGMSPVSFGQKGHQSIDSFVGATELKRERESVTEDAIDGVPVWRIEYSGAPVTARLWIAPGLGYSLVRAETAGQFKGKTLRDSMQCVVSKVEPAGLWFPKELRNQRDLDGEVVTTEVIRVTDVKLNTGVDPQAFTYAALEPRPGTHVADRTARDGGTRVWNGTELVPLAAPVVEMPFPVAATRGRWLIFVAVNFGFLALLLLLIHVRRRRNPAG